MQIYQIDFKLKRYPRGFHLITNEIETKAVFLKNIQAGIANLLIKHTSASLSLNENADPTVRQDFETFFTRLVPEDTKLYKHTAEGLDDMTSHIKSSILGSSLTLPITNGRFNLGTWQGIYLCEHRNAGKERTIVLTAFG